MNKRILLAIPDHSSYKKGIVSALLRMGAAVELFDFRKGTVAARAAGVVNNRLNPRSQLLTAYINNSIQDRLLAKVVEFKPHILLIIKGHEINAETVRTITRKGVITINWYPDWLVLWPWIKRHAPAYSIFISSCLNLNKAVQKIHSYAFYLPFAADPDKLLHHEPKLYPISFVGQYSPRREHYFAKLVKLGLHIWGYQGWQSSSLRQIAQPPTTAEETLQIFRRSKIIVNILTGDNTFHPANINNRTFEVLQVGSFLLNHDQPVLHKHFPVQKCMGTFTTPQELLKKTRYFLMHEKEREKIAQYGWNYVKRHHSYDIRLKELFRKIIL
ncbi:MAG: hypothetical protein UV59_C0001G0057 [Candidatus Gottesmanbacteria bacterium GW2011_GWA1_43_11]|uniref:Spore protein YkvP/CgeB glycosyl transferase-like domain-containing protein n=1 Tax=Candidatus Gottesmanbacteria bacterium GW2011_GWA1_43_11 TaxID=1618436 RepID=A0A0G1CLF5_9BACT|nr:MAG: hypothetical protein UV59_C0001G0057 [Candidatus Gottesmanbacteria bacterium GW2011_GWA1_43_11]